MNTARRCLVAVAVAAMIAAGLWAPPASAALNPPTLAAPTTLGVSRNVFTPVTGLTLADNGSPTAQVQVAATQGTLSLGTTTGLTLTTGDGTNDPELQFSGNVADVQTALDSLGFLATNNYIGAASVTFKTSPGGGLYNPDNGHFYQFVETGNDISWTQAETDAAALTYGGLQGYLATVTSASEQSFVSSKLNGEGWFGASDDPAETGSTESRWFWVTGPEAGTEFWAGTYSGLVCSDAPCAPVNGEYNNWAPGEPNNCCGSENFIHFLNGGAWNDYPVSSNIERYLVEFGGMPGDVSPIDSDTININVAPTAPAAPPTPALTVGKNKLGVTWSAPADNGGAAVTGYKVEYSTNGTTWTTASNNATSPYEVTGLTNGTAYQIRVSATNSVGTGTGAVATATPQGVPEPPAGLAITPNTSGAVITWNAPTDTGGLAITSYKAEYRVAGGQWQSAGTASPTTLTGLAPGTNYEVRVLATNALGDSTFATQTFTTSIPPSTGVSVPVFVNPQTGEVQTVPTVRTGNLPPTAIAATPSGQGSWTVTSDGGVFTAGDAGFYGSMGGVRLSSPAVNIAGTPSGGGYLVVAADGGVFAFGDAKFEGSMGGKPLNSPVKSIGTTCSNDGYYLVAGDGGVFAFGQAGFFGSMGGKPLNQEMVGIVDACGRDGYWTFAADGGVFTFGDAKFHGSLGSNPPAGGIIGMVSAPDGEGYWLIGADRKAYGFGSAAS